MVKVEVSIEDDGWNSLSFIKLIERACSVTLEQLGIDSRFQISVLGCSDSRIATLNSEFRNKEEVTNVLSWPAEERLAQKPGILPPKPKFLEKHENELGDLAFAYNFCVEEAKLAGRLPTDHLTHLAVHGTMHLLGFDHILEKDAVLMEGIEIRILKKLGIEDPYK